MVSRDKKRQRRTEMYLSNGISREISATYRTMSLTLRHKHSANVQCITYAREDSYPKEPNKDTSRLVSFCPTTYVKNVLYAYHFDQGPEMQIPFQATSALLGYLYKPHIPIRPLTWMCRGETRPTTNRFSSQVRLRLHFIRWLVGILVAWLYSDHGVGEIASLWFILEPFLCRAFSALQHNGMKQGWAEKSPLNSRPSRSYSSYCVSRYIYSSFPPA